MTDYIHFFSEEVEFEIPHEKIITKWILEVIQQHEFKLDMLNYIFCTDNYLFDINAKYLNHHSLTDIITFDYAEKSGQINGEIYISIDRVKENAEEFGISFNDELHRVMAHGALHLLGFDDHSAEEKLLMRQKEDACLSLLKI